MVWIKGEGFSREHCDKISASLRGKKQKKSHVINAANARRGFSQSDKQKAVAKKMFAKAFLVTDPNGMTHIVQNLAEFARKTNAPINALYQATKYGRPYRGFLFRRMH